MSTIDEIRRIRLDKVKTLKDLGINPYPTKSTKDISNSEIVSKYDVFENKKVHVTGRIISWREHGQLIFGHIQDQSGKIQIFIKKDDLSATNIKKQTLGFEHLNLIDIGDFIEVFGTINKSIRGEVSIFPGEIAPGDGSARPRPCSEW